MERFDKKLVIITHASDNYGFGHVMRSLRNYNLLKFLFMQIGSKEIKTAEKNYLIFLIQILYLDLNNKVGVEKIINDFNPEGIIDLLSIDTG